MEFTHAHGCVVSELPKIFREGESGGRGQQRCRQALGLQSLRVSSSKKGMEGKLKTCRECCLSILSCEMVLAKIPHSRTAGGRFSVRRAEFKFCFSRDVDPCFGSGRHLPERVGRFWLAVPLVVDQVCLPIALCTTVTGGNGFDAHGSWSLCCPKYFEREKGG